MAANGRGAADAFVRIMGEMGRRDFDTPLSAVLDFRKTRSEIMTASVNGADKIQTEIRALEHELDRRENKEKQRF